MYIWKKEKQYSEWDSNLVAAKRLLVLCASCPFVFVAFWTFQYHMIVHVYVFICMFVINFVSHQICVVYTPYPLSQCEYNFWAIEPLSVSLSEYVTAVLRVAVETRVQVSI